MLLYAAFHAFPIMPFSSVHCFGLAIETTFPKRKAEVIQMRNLNILEHIAGLIIYSHFSPVLCNFFIMLLSFHLAPTTSEAEK